jgi:uncharacterized protein YoxC
LASRIAQQATLHSQPLKPLEFLMTNSQTDEVHDRGLNPLAKVNQDINHLKHRLNPLNKVNQQVNHVNQDVNHAKNSLNPVTQIKKQVTAVKGKLNALSNPANALKTFGLK